MTITFGHQQLRNRYRFEGKLALETAVRVSSGRPSLATDAPFICTYDDSPYIPGSSLRGAWRSQMEQILGAGVQPDLTACTLFERGKDCADIFRTRQAAWHHLTPEEKELETRNFISTELCAVCRLFGSTMFATRLFIEDAYPENVPEAKRRLIIRDGVGIDRDTGAARDGVKFDYQVMDAFSSGQPPSFEFRMTAENLEEQDERLITLMLKVLKLGISVGGKRSGGLGKIKLLSCRVTGFEDSRAAFEALLAGSEVYQRINKWEVCPHA